jgi:hypothetical protein
MLLQLLAVPNGGQSNTAAAKEGHADGNLAPGGQPGVGRLAHARGASRQSPPSNGAVARMALTDDQLPQSPCVCDEQRGAVPQQRRPGVQLDVPQAHAPTRLVSSRREAVRPWVARSRNDHLSHRRAELEVLLHAPAELIRDQLELTLQPSSLAREGLGAWLGAAWSTEHDAVVPARFARAQKIGLNDIRSRSVACMLIPFRAGRAGASVGPGSIPAVD